MCTGAPILVMSANDISEVFRRRISAKQLFKNVTTLVGGISGGYIGEAIGTPLGPAGTIIGGTLSGAVAHNVLDHMIEDDAVEMPHIVNQNFIPLVQEYMLSQEELFLVVDEIRYILSQGELLNMYASNDRNVFANKLIEKAIQKVIDFRAIIYMPTL